MIQNRTLQFIGLAYGSTPVTVTAQINGTTVFSGEVSTIDTPWPEPTDLSSGNVLFSVTDSSLFPTNFAGSYPMTITASNGLGIVLGDVLSNWMFPVDSTNFAPTLPTTFLNCYNGDPRTNVVIDGVPQTVTRPPNGAWYRTVRSGSTLTCDLNVILGCPTS